MLSVRSRVLEGRTLASALGEYPKVFPEIFQATVAAGEQSGHLDSVLERLADYTEDKESTKAIISKALYYPIGLVFIAFGIVTFLLAYVVPKVVQVFDSMGQELPLLTRIMIYLSDFIKDWGLLVFLLFTGLFFLWRHVLQNESVKMRVHRFMLKVPLLSKIIRGSNASQFARTLSILAASGVPVLDALGIASQVLTNRPSSSLVGLVAQRLVRILCNECKTTHTPSQAEYETLNIDPAEDVTIYLPHGCTKCNHSGYVGRTGIYEVVLVDESLRNMIHDGSAEHEIETYARSRYAGITEDGMRLVIKGDTSLEEVLRVTREM